MAAKEPQRRRPQARGEARREAILDAAVRLFARHGFRGTGILGLAKEVGITHAGVLHHFGSKERLLLAVVDRRDREQAGLIEHLGRLRGLESLRAIELIAEDTVDDPLHARLFTVLIAENLHPDDPLNGYFRNRYALLREFVAHAVRSGQEDGELKPGSDPEAVAGQVMAFVAGMQVQWLLDPEAIDLRAAYRDYVGGLIAELSSETG
jgi:AcrR family transcriptional regulator